MTGQITLADGNSLEITAGDQHTSFLVACLTEAMQLKPVQKPDRRVIVSKDHGRANSSNGNGSREIILCSSKREDTVICRLVPADSGLPLALQLMQLSLVISQYAQTHGGILLHGALVEWKGAGVILAGRSGTGKTTASRRLMPPWRSLCDDFTLVVRDLQGVCQAHPWPTWSRFASGKPNETWDVHQAIPLKGIFFLKQSQKDRIEPVGNGRTACLLTSSWEQARYGMPYEIKKEQARTLRLRCFKNICELAQSMPCFILHLSLTGSFWQQIELIIDD